MGLTTISTLKELSSLYFINVGLVSGAGVEVPTGNALRGLYNSTDLNVRSKEQQTGILRLPAASFTGLAPLTRICNLRLLNNSVTHEQAAILAALPHLSCLYIGSLYLEPFRLRFQVLTFIGLNDNGFEKMIHDADPPTVMAPCAAAFPALQCCEVPWTGGKFPAFFNLEKAELHAPFRAGGLAALAHCPRL